jgi:hypothetical protein
MAGWALSAIKTLPGGHDQTGWLAYGICPRCHAMVITEDNRPDNAYGDQTEAHQQWHAETDHPIPAEVLAEAQAMASARQG